MGRAGWLTTDELAERTRRAAQAAVDAGRALRLGVDRATVLHDVFSVVVHLEPTPVVARVQVVVPPDLDPQRQAARQQRELDVAAWLDATGVPVVPPSPLVPREPTRHDGFGMTFWQLADVAADHEPYAGVAASAGAELHAGLVGYPGPLPFLAPFTEGLPGLVAALAPSELLDAADVARAREQYATLRAVLADPTSFAARHPGVTCQPLQGDAPSHNVIRTTAGPAFSDFEDVCLGPVEWDLALLGPEAVAEYDEAAAARGLRRTDPAVGQVMDDARRLQVVACAALAPQLPLLARGLAPVIEDWRARRP